MFEFSLKSTTVTVGLMALVGCATVEQPPVRPELSSRDRVVQLQIFLDSVNFGPGVVDGRDGEFTAKALTIYQRVMGRNPDFSGVVPYTTYVVTAEDLKRIGTVPSTPEAMAKQPRLPYTSLTELLAERAHTTRDFVRRLNPGLNVDALGLGGIVKLPNVARPLRVASFPSAYPAADPSKAATRRVVVDTNERQLRVIDGDKLLAVFPITPGSSTHPAPKGDWKILRAGPVAVVSLGRRRLGSRRTHERRPPDPAGGEQSGRDSRAGLNKPGIGIHGTPSPETIGRSGSHGCIRLANWDAATFYTLVPKGTPVAIR